MKRNGGEDMRNGGEDMVGTRHVSNNQTCWPYNYLEKKIDVGQ